MSLSNDWNLHHSLGGIGKLSPQIFTSESEELRSSPITSKSVLDDELVEWAKDGRPEAFEELHRRYRRRLLSCALRITKNFEDSEDAVQETFLKAFRRIEGFAGRSSFSTWLTRILINTCVLKLRQRKISPLISLDEPSNNGASWKYIIPDPLIDVEGEYRQKQRLEYLTKAISTLNPKLRVVVETYQTHDCSLAEIAELNQISLAATKSRMLRAREALQNFYCNSDPA